MSGLAHKAELVLKHSKVQIKNYAKVEVAYFSFFFFL